MDINRLSALQKKEKSKMRQRKAAFEYSQEQKKKSWSRLDDQGMTRLNLPQIASDNKALKSASMNQVRQLWIAREAQWILM